MRGHEHFWDQIKAVEGKPFTMNDIDFAGNANRASVRDFLNRLERAGYIARIGFVPQAYKGRNPQVVYRQKIFAKNTPRLRRSGEHCPPLGNEQIWRAMKMLNSFTVKDLALAATANDIAVKESTARAYIKNLKKAGYLVMQRKAGGAVYRLRPRMNTGPLAPQIRRNKDVFDPNTGMVYETAIPKVMEAADD